MFALVGSRLRSLDATELLEILRMQCGLPYDTNLLRRKGPMLLIVGWGVFKFVIKVQVHEVRQEEISYYCIVLDYASRSL